MEAAEEKAIKAEGAMLELRAKARRLAEPIAMLATDDKGPSIRRLKYHDVKWTNVKGNEDKGLAAMHQHEEKHYSLYQRILMKLSNTNEVTDSTADAIKDNLNSVPDLDELVEDLVDVVGKGMQFGSTCRQACAQLMSSSID